MWGAPPPNPHKQTPRRGVKQEPPGLRPAPKALLDGCAARPRPPRAAPPVPPSRHGPLPLVAQRERLGRGGLSPLSAAIGGNTRQARIACEISLSPWKFIKRLFGKRSASGRRRGPCGQGGAEAWACGQRASVVHMCRVGPACPAGRTGGAVVHRSGAFAYPPGEAERGSFRS